MMSRPAGSIFFLPSTNRRINL